jgi:hypothetical protein
MLAPIEGKLMAENSITIRSVSDGWDVVVVEEGQMYAHDFESADLPTTSQKIKASVSALP